VGHKTNEAKLESMYAYMDEVKAQDNPTADSPEGNCPECGGSACASWCALNPDSRND
jgi:hypothetical protein